MSKTEGEARLAPTMLKAPTLSDRVYHQRTALIIGAAVCIYLLGLGQVHLWDRDEPWYAQTSRQMLNSGDWVIPHFLEKARTAKPILIYWCQMAGMAIFGDNSLGARFPSTVAITLVMTTLAILVNRIAGARRAMYTVLIFATSGLVMMTAKMCIIDGVQLVFIMGAQVCLYALYRAGNGRRLRRAEEGGLYPPTSQKPTAWIALILWVCIGFTGLAKGPFALIVLTVSVIALALLDVGKQYRSKEAWKRAIAWWRLLRPHWGLPLALGMVAPWLITAYQRNPEFVRILLGEAKRHTVNNQSGQWPWPGYFLIAIWPTFFPWCLLLPGGLLLAWKHRSTPQVRFALALVIGNWLVVECMKTKLPHYLLPAFAWLAFLTATGLMRCMRSQYFELNKRGFFIFAGAWGVGALIASNLPWIAGLRYGDLHSKAAAAAFTVTGTVYVAVVLGMFVKRRLGGAAVAMGLGMFAIMGVMYGLYLPQAEYLRLPQRIAAELKKHNLTQKGQVMMVGYREPSLAFYQGGTIRDEDDRGYLSETSPNQWPEWIVTTKKVFEKLPEERRAWFQVVSSHHGVNYNSGSPDTTVLILRKSEGLKALTQQ